jgi:tetratricopeptide (TPR) repeat protein
MGGRKRRFREKARGRRVASAALYTTVVAAVGVLLLAAVGCSDAVEKADHLWATGDLPGAEAIYKGVLASHPDDLQALSGLAGVLYVQGKHDEALPIQERVVAADPDEVQIRIELGFNYLNHQNRSGDAVRVLTEAAALDGSAKNLTFLGQAQIEAGDHTGAETSLRKAIEVDPQYGHSYSVLVRMLEDDMRSSDATEVRDLAAARGIDITVP